MITRQKVIQALVKLKDAGINVDAQMESLSRNSGIPKDIILFLQENSPQFQFYRDIQKNQKALLKNILNYESLNNIGKLKLCSSLITRAMIAVEYKNLNECLLDDLDLGEVSNAINKALNDRDYRKLDEVLKRQKDSMKLFVKERVDK